MDPITIIAAINTAGTLAMKLLDLGRDVKPLIEGIVSVSVKGKDVTQADLDKLIAMTDAWSFELQGPIAKPE